MEKETITFTTRGCKKTDYSFVFGLVKKSLFPFVAKYYQPDKAMFDERFYHDYKERTIILRGKRRIGFYHLVPQVGVLHVKGIFISSAYQRKGIGQFLMRYFETLGFKRILLEVWENNPAYRFYRKWGYCVFKKKNHKYFMEKRL